MANSFVRVAPDSTGKLVQTFSNVVGANTVEANAVSLVDSLGVSVGTTASPIAVKQATATSSAITSVSVTTTSLSVLASNANRRGASVYVESGATLYLALAGSASLTAYTVQVAVGSYYEVPANYSGALFGITSAGTAVCRVTEFT